MRVSLKQGLGISKGKGKKLIHNVYCGGHLTPVKDSKNLNLLRGAAGSEVVVDVHHHDILK